MKTRCVFGVFSTSEAPLSYVPSTFALLLFIRVAKNLFTGFLLKKNKTLLSHLLFNLVNPRIIGLDECVKCSESVFVLHHEII